MSRAGSPPRGRRRPALLHFFVLGALLLGADALLGGGGPERVVAVARVAADAPADAVARAIDEAILVEVGVAMGWHETDPLITGHLAESLRYARPELADEPDDALLALALDLGMARTDPIVRRRLADRGLRVVDARRLPEPDDATLEAWRDAHPARFSRPARVRFGHVFLSRERRGDALEADARALLAELSAADVAADDGARRGDPSLLARPVEVATIDVVTRTWGGDLGAALAAAPLDAWSGPHASAFGLHLVRPTARTEERLPELAAIRAEVRADWLAAERTRARAEHLATLRATWPVAIERLPPQLAEGAH